MKGLTLAVLSRSDAVEVVRRACPAFGISPEAEVEFVKYRENVVFRVVDTDGAAYVVRIHRYDHRTDAEVQTENSYMQLLFEAGLAVSEVVPTLDGAVFAPVTAANGYTYQVDSQHWVTDSAPLGDCGDAWTGAESPGVDAFEKLGVVCGQFHALSHRIGRTPDFTRRPWDLPGLVGDTPLWGDPRRLATTPQDRAVIDTAMHNIGQQLAALGTDADVYGVIHADFSPENVLLSPGALTLIDFDDFGEGWWLFDLATVLFWYHRHPKADEYKAALLTGYQQHFTIPAKAERALNALVLARGLTYLGWAADRPDDETSNFLKAEVLPVVVDLCRRFNEHHKKEHQTMPAASQHNELIERREATIGEHSPLFYSQPRHFVEGDGVWLTDVHGERYLDAYNNVPHVGHANARVADAVSKALHTYNAHTRYLSEPVIAYAEQLLETFDAPLDRVYFTNSGSESNELALRIARHTTGNQGIIVTDHSYHGNTLALAELTTGLQVSEPRGKHIRTIHVPDLDQPSDRTEEQLLNAALTQIDEAIRSLDEAGFGVAALLIEPIFSTEGMPAVPQHYLPGLLDRVRAAGGLVISDEVQAGLGRLGNVWWAHQATGFTPDFATLGKPLGNGYPLGGVVTTAEIMEDFSSQNEYFNTFAGTAAAAAAGSTVLRELQDRELLAHSEQLGARVAQRLQHIVDNSTRAVCAKGRGLFFGLALVDEAGQPDPNLTNHIVEQLLAQRILVSKIGPDNNVLKIRPPLVISQYELDTVLDALETTIMDYENASVHA